MDVAERRNGVRPDLETGSTHAGFKGRFAALSRGGDSPIGDLMQSILFEDRVFEEALMNPVLLALASYMCGYSVVLSSMGCFMKGPNESSFSLHTDTPLPAQGVAYGYESQEDSIARAQRSVKYLAAYHKEQGTAGLASQTLYG